MGKWGFAALVAGGLTLFAPPASADDEPPLGLSVALERVAGFSDGSGNSYSLFYSAVSLDMAAVLRVTQSFNVLGGIAYDHVFAGSGSETENGMSADLKAGGQLLAGSLWFGIGGYVL